MTLLVMVSSLIALAFSIRAFLLQPILPPSPTWVIQSIDTVKYSRDQARRHPDDPQYLTAINTQVRQIAQTGANYVAIGTPYDEEFLPVLRLWVTAARRNNLHVWFRGNFSGWENWFNYSPITPDEHTHLTQEFILNNPDLFENKDIFTSCPECENGIIGDPRKTNQANQFRQFLVSEKKVADHAFRQIDKDVITGYFSMNYDVAKLIMDPETTSTLGGVVTIDHYTKTSNQLINDIKTIADQSRGKVILGEIGVPIPDIHGIMTDKEQADWLQESLQKLSGNTSVLGTKLLDQYRQQHLSMGRQWKSQALPRNYLFILQ